jgi:DNA-3-methyladenine glycosylase I
MAQARTPTRCGWCGSDPLYVDYHDREWGVPSRDDRHLFEMLILEGAQAGLSWITILRKRAAYREAYEGFDIARVARFDARRIERLLKNEGIVRNRLKLQSSVTNACATLALQDQCGSLADYLWGFVDGRPQRNAWKSMRDVPACTPVSNALSKDLKRRGFGFVGSTIMYAFMQAVGMVNDHTTDCHRYRVVTRLGR